MSEWIRIRVKDFYKDAVGELEYTYVTREVYEALVDTFRKEAHAQEMRDIRHTTKDGYTEGETEDLVELTVYKRQDRGIGRGYGHPADGNRNPAESNAVTHPSAERAAVFLFF